jgi:hypothetical protein
VIEDSSDIEMEGTMVSEMKRETPTEVPRKKFMKPPVKVACLSW